MLNCKHGSSHGSVPLDWPESVKQQQGHLQGKGLEAGQELSLQVCPCLCSQKVKAVPSLERSCWLYFGTSPRDCG